MKLQESSVTGWVGTQTDRVQKQSQIHFGEVNVQQSWHFSSAGKECFIQ